MRILLLLPPVVVLAAVVVLATDSRPGDADVSTDAARALDAYVALDHFFHHGNVWAASSLRRGWSPAEAWPFSQAFAATIGVARVDPGHAGDVRLRLTELDRYWNDSTQPAAYDSVPNGPQYYDDNEWIGIDLLAAHRLLGTRLTLGRAERLFNLVVSGWDGQPDHACPGGVYWVRAAQHDRNTVSTANGALLGLLLYRETHFPGYLRWATQMYAWVYKCLGAPNGLFWDHLDSAGHVEPTQWSYNQGAMIAAGVLLAQATDDTSYLRRAQAVANAALAHFAPILDEEPPYFLAIFFEDLLLLQEADPGGHYLDAAQAYADRMWTEKRDPHTGLFRFHPGKPVLLLEQAAMVRIYAALAAGAPW